MSLAVRRAIYGKLSSDTTLTNQLGAAPAPYTKGIYYGVAPKGAAGPYVIFQKQSGVPTYSLAALAFDSDLWMVKAVDHGTSADRAETAAARIDALLTDATLSISGKALMYLRREADIDYPETVDGEIFFHTGASFRLMSQ